MLKVEKYNLGILNTNCYFLISSGRLVLIDPGSDGEFIAQKVVQANLKLEKILITHGHFDHLLACTELKLIFNCDIYMDFSDKFLLEKAITSSNYFTNIKNPIKPIVDKDLKNFKSLSFDNMKIDVIKTPGHTPGSTSFFIKSLKKLFSGDLVFSDGSPGDYRHKYSNKNSLEESLKKISLYDEKTLIYPGHGNEFHLEDIKNPLNLLIENEFLNVINN